MDVRATYTVGKRLISVIVGIASGLVSGRLVAHILAARSDNTVFHILDLLSAPLVRPFARLNAAQPQFGAQLDLAALVALGVLLLLGYGAWRLLHYAEQH